MIPAYPGDRLHGLTPEEAGFPSPFLTLAGQARRGQKIWDVYS